METAKTKELIIYLNDAGVIAKITVNENRTH